jgi:glutamate formiminotransferase
MTLLEAVPNVSEGRRPEVLERLAAAAAGGGAWLLDASADPDHNRSVLTLAGEPEPLAASLVALAETAVASIDLTVHRGVHPRIGALDVVPLIPLGGAPMDAAVATARRVGAAIAERCAVPVLLYEAAAARPDRTDLADLRRGGLAALGERLARADGQPDFGPARLHPTAGATAVGARDFLIAFNVLLASADVACARAIAARVRASAGGLPAVKALGFYLATRQRAQVSMNLTDFRRTGLAAALAAVRRESAALGVAVESCEIVGLVPRAALDGTEGDPLLAAVLGPERVLEERLRRYLPATVQGGPRAPGVA